VPYQQNDEVQFLCEVAAWVVDTQPQLYDIDQKLTETRETARPFEPLWCGELFCERWVVQYGPEDSHLKAIVRRQSHQQKVGLRQALLPRDFHDYHRRDALLRHHTKIVTLVGHRPLTIPPDIAARRRAEGEDPDAFKALILDALRQREHQRLSAWETGRFPNPPLFGHRKFVVPLWASVHEVAVVIGLLLAQEGLIPDEMVKFLLVTTMGVPAPLVDYVWERLKRHFSDAQYPLSLRAYIKRLVREQRRPEGGGMFQDEAGDEYWTVQRAAQELQQQVCQEREEWPGSLKPRVLKTNKATLYRWIKNARLRTKEFSYRAMSGVRKTVKAVARADITCVKTTYLFDEAVIILLCKAHHITRVSAERQYRRICCRLGIRASALIKSDEKAEAIRKALAADPQVVHYREDQKQQKLE
jgi:hypothetical protein